MNSTMHFKRKWAWNKKHILIAVAAAAVLAIIVLTVVLRFSPLVFTRRRKSLIAAMFASTRTMLSVAALLFVML